jgi:hypothetical protein
MTGRDRQTVADMAVERCGSAEALFTIARRNGVSVNAEVADMKLTDEPMADRRTAEYIQSQGFSPANVYESEPDVLTNDSTGAARLENVVTESNETIIQ